MTMEYNLERFPRPLVYMDNAGFWDAAKRHELALLRCGNCQSFVHPPLPMCPKCQSLEKEWVRVSGKGKVYSWVTYHESPHPGFAAPYTTVLVELDEGPRLVSNVVDVAPEDLRAGMSVEVVFEEVVENVTLPKFKKVG